MTITPQTSIRDLQQQFQKEFPFLKIEISDKRHGMGERIRYGHYYHPSFKIQAVAKRNQDGVIVIQPWQITGAVEQYLYDKFGLQAQIFRKEAEGWVETAGTDYINLDEQNEIGKNLALRAGASVWTQPETQLRAVF